MSTTKAKRSGTTAARRRTAGKAVRKASTPKASARARAKPNERSRAPADENPSLLAEAAARNTLSANPLIGIRRKEVIAAAGSFLSHLARRPRAVSAQYGKFLGEFAGIVAGRSTLAAEAGDRRFADPAWTSSGGFRRLLQSYLALGKTLNQCVDEAEMDALATERARFVVSLFVDAIAPTNTIATNPTALKKLVDTKGVSVIRGVANFVEDMTSGTGLPRQVDARPFTVGKNVATTPGAVVYRNDLLELIQYAPIASQVHRRPLLIVPPQINKYYVFDLTPAKSLVQFSLGSGVQTFVASWRNPKREHAAWGLDAYVTALEEAIDAMREITGSNDVNVLGACSGGITLSSLLGYLAARGDPKVASATLAVCVLDTAATRDTTAGLFVTPKTIAAAKAASRKRGVVEGRDLARMFAWMRPNDLIWNYVVNNYLMGNEPPAYDILFWNNDTTSLPAQLHADFLDLFTSNSFLEPGKMRVRGRRIDIGKTGLETYIVGGLTDHITPWKGVYETARLYGGARSTFVLSNSGHVQSLVNPPGNPRAWLMAGPARAATPNAWLGRQQKAEGSWWTHWREWIRARSGPLQAAPAALGSARHPPIVAAPGTYVLER